ncbi:hypothetical protein PVAND_014207 [Polypedilum vanderplanki]|uniref:UDP-glucuronosyltransferase n=1 Tax=Polypedilum vanderplanki TaxID=319348 RepID=A0A9J6CSV8_POLVA|nr:hypothetical protein PVAND_014207 [Polypedilum vanderplanki]
MYVFSFKANADKIARKSMKIFSLAFLITTCAVIKSNEASNILFLSGIPCPSHYIFNKAIAEGLAARGHNLTFLSPDIEKNSTENFHYVHLEEMYAHYYNGSEHIDLLEMSKESTLKSVFSFYDFDTFMCEGIALSKGIEVMKNYPDDFKFDLVLHDYTCGPCLLGLMPKFKYPPIIGVSAFNNPPYTVDIVGGDKLGLTVKPFYLLHYDINMNFIQRLHNGLINFLDSFYRKYFATPSIDKQMRKVFGDSIPYADDLDKMTALMLVNSNPAVDYPESLPPNIIQVGGLQIKEPKTVPSDINQFIVKGKKGAILMTLGTNMRSDEIGKDAINAVLEAFRSIPDYNFLWKFETSEMLQDLPKNVMIKDWLPQNDILAHPHVKAFITHGGLLSTHEAIWYGVPMIAIPFIADQHRNVFKSVSAGIAVKVDYHTITMEKLKKAIVEVLHNPKIRKNIQKKSKLFRDQPEKPLDRALWWCEYVIRNPKPTHLKQAELSLGLLGSHFWDIQILIILIFIIVYRIIKSFHRKIRNSKIDTEIQQKKNK